MTRANARRKAQRHAVRYHVHTLLHGVATEESASPNECKFRSWSRTSELRHAANVGGVHNGRKRGNVRFIRPKQRIQPQHSISCIQRIQ
jgi:hypothetical protein